MEPVSLHCRIITNDQTEVLTGAEPLLLALRDHWTTRHGLEGCLPVFLLHPHPSSEYKSIVFREEVVLSAHIYSSSISVLISRGLTGDTPAVASLSDCRFINPTNTGKTGEHTFSPLLVKFRNVGLFFFFFFWHYICTKQDEKFMKVDGKPSLHILLLPKLSWEKLCRSFSTGRHCKPPLLLPPMSYFVLRFRINPLYRRANETKKTSNIKQPRGKFLAMKSRRIFWHPINELQACG